MGNERGLGEPIPGDILGNRYEILEEIGRGGMATVYKGRDLRLSRKVAVKVFRGGFADAVDPRRTTQEMQLLGGVNHPAIVSVLDASNGDERFGSYLVMELVVGDDLGALLKRARGPLSADFARRIVGDVASALQLLHAQGVVHRDVKPGNILVSAGGGQGPSGVTAKLTDFGIAQMVDGAALTASDSILGTAAYLSPEQVRGSRLRPASDVYSLGLVLLEALTGRRAFPGPAAEAAVARLHRPPALPTDASPALADLLSRMTALDPSARPHAEEVAAALREDLAGAITAPDAEHTIEVPRAVLAGAGLPPVIAAAAMATPAHASPVEEDATLPHPSLWTPAAGIPLGPPAAPDTGVRPLVVPPTPQSRRRFPTLLAVGASALAAAVAGVIITSSTGIWNAPTQAAAVNQAGTKDGVTADSPAPQGAAPAGGGGTAPLQAATGGDVVATKPHARTSPGPSPSRSGSTPAPTTGSSSSPAPTASATSPALSSDPTSTPTGPAPSDSPTPSESPTPSDSSTPTDSATPSDSATPVPTDTAGSAATASADPTAQSVFASS